MGVASHSGRGYSIWIMPSPGSYHARKISGVIDGLAGELKAPRFSPHVTLIGSICAGRAEALRATQSIAESADPFTLYLGSVGHSDAYFRSVFIRVRKTSPLMELNKAASEILGADCKGFMPHLSLLYSDSDEGARKRIVRRAAASALIGPRGFRADRIYLYSTAGPVRRWKPIGVFRLGKPRKAVP